MGNRISISFKANSHGYESVWLYDQWGGRCLRQEVRQYIDELNAADLDPREPLGRREPWTVLIDFVRWLCVKRGYDRVENSLYLAKRHGGDDSDMGHYTWDLELGCFV